MSKDIFGMLNTLILVASAIGAFIFLSDGAQSIATKDYHDLDVKENNEVVLKSIEKVELNTLPPRIRPLIQSKQEACMESRDFSHEADLVLQELLARYQELRGVAWNIGKCIDGVWTE